MSANVTSRGMGGLGSVRSRPGNGWHVAVARYADTSAVYFGTESECQRMAEIWANDKRANPEEIAVAMIHDWVKGGRARLVVSSRTGSTATITTTVSPSLSFGSAGSATVRLTP